MAHTPSSQDYLKSIYALTRDQDKVSTSELAKRLDIKPASVTDMLKKLAKNDPPLINYVKYQGAALTPAGREMALSVVRRHRLIELFLHEKLGYTCDEVHAEAELLEHVISPEMEQRMAEILDHPTTDPHGQPIPDGGKT